MDGMGYNLMFFDDEYTLVSLFVYYAQMPWCFQREMGQGIYPTSWFSASIRQRHSAYRWTHSDVSLELEINGWYVACKLLRSTRSGHITFILSYAVILIYLIHPKIGTDHFSSIFSAACSMYLIFCLHNLNPCPKQFKGWRILYTCPFLLSHAFV